MFPGIHKAINQVIGIRMSFTLTWLRASAESFIVFVFLSAQEQKDSVSSYSISCAHFPSRRALYHPPPPN